MGRPYRAGLNKRPWRHRPHCGVQACDRDTITFRHHSPSQDRTTGRMRAVPDPVARFWSGAATDQLEADGPNMDQVTMIVARYVCGHPDWDGNRTLMAIRDLVLRLN